MKYPKEFYENTEFYGPNEEIENHSQKIIKARKEHECCNCGEIIKTGRNALYEVCFMDGPQRCYTCISCCDKWLDELKEHGTL